MVNAPRFDVAREQLRAEGLIPMESSFGEVRFQFFMLPLKYDRAHILRVIETYLKGQYEAHTIKFWRGRNDREIKVTWQE